MRLGYHFPRCNRLLRQVVFMAAANECICCNQRSIRADKRLLRFKCTRQRRGRICICIDISRFRRRMCYNANIFCNQENRLRNVPYGKSITNRLFCGTICDRSIYRFSKRKLLFYVRNPSYTVYKCSLYLHYISTNEKKL